MKRADRIKLFSLAACAAALFAAGAEAQQDKVVARLKSISGNVLVSQESGLAAGNESQGLANGTRIITTANSEAVVLFDNGCEVRLKENQRFEIESDKPCALMVAQALGGQPVAAVAPSLIPLLFPAGVGAAIASDTRDRPAVSPN